jgi:F-type H+-transporting ATPase subunit b
MLSVDMSFVFHILNFSVLFIIFKYFFEKKIVSFIEKRREIINNQLSDIEKSKINILRDREAIEKEIKESKEKGRSIIENSKKEAEEVKKTIIDSASNTYKQIIKQGEIDIQNMQREMENSLKTRVLSISTKIAGKIIGDPSSYNEYNLKMIEKMFNEKN